MSGRPKPTRLKVIEGNPGRRPLNEREPRPRPGMPSCPRWFDGEARTEWRWLIAELKYMGLLTRADRGIMIGYCIAVADVREAVETLRTEGRTLKTTNGNVIQNPAVVRKNRALALLRSYCAELGLSPTSRARISVPLPEKKRSAWEGLLA